MHGRSVPPLERMTIRLYCTYYRIAKRRYYREQGASGRVYEDLQMKFVDVETLYGIDSPANFIRFATDHYGELGLSRLNIFASNKR